MTVVLLSWAQEASTTMSQKLQPIEANAHALGAMAGSQVVKSVGGVE
jgi:hypothetical protein